ncbi:general odorant-binding protein 19d-like [Anastrepha obliqua]
MTAFSCFLIFITMTSLPTILLADLQPPHYGPLRAMTEAAIEDCYEDAAQKVKVEITDEGFEELLKGSRDNLMHNTKCLRYCIMRKNGLFNASNSLDKEKLVDIFEIIHPQVEKEKLLNVLQKCAEKTEKETDNCERASVAAMCVLDELKGEGVTNI